MCMQAPSWMAFKTQFAQSFSHEEFKHYWKFLNSLKKRAHGESTTLNPLCLVDAVNNSNNLILITGLSAAMEAQITRSYLMPAIFLTSTDWPLNDRSADLFNWHEMKSSMVVCVNHIHVHHCRSVCSRHTDLQCVCVTYLISAFSTLLRGSVTGRICPVSTLSIIPFVLNFYFTLVLISSTTAEVWTAVVQCCPGWSAETAKQEESKLAHTQKPWQ